MSSDLLGGGGWGLSWLREQNRPATRGIGADEVVITWGPCFNQVESGVAVLLLDSSVSQQHEVSCELTQHPVEDGVSISDHVRKIPRTLQIAGVVSAWPLGKETLTSEDPVRAAWTLLIDMVGQAFAVSTALETYPRMVLRRVAVTREARNGDDLLPQLELVELVTVTMMTGVLPPEVVKRKQQKASAPDASKKGKQGTDKVTAATILESIAQLIGVHAPAPVVP